VAVERAAGIWTRMLETSVLNEIEYSEIIITEADVVRVKQSL
jgi:hypothetical protein